MYYKIDFSDGTDWASQVNCTPDNIEADTNNDAANLAKEALEDWIADGDYQPEGEAVRLDCYIELDGPYVDEDCEIPADNCGTWTESQAIDLEPDHDALIKAAGGDTECDHDWQEPDDGFRGASSHGGTTFSFTKYCSHCGLQRTETHYGVQRNPGQADTWEYYLPETNA